MSEEYPITRAASGKPFRVLMVKDVEAYTIIDAEDYDSAAQFKWTIFPTGQVFRARRYGSSAHKAPKVLFYLARQILDASGAVKKGRNIAHFNQINYDNRRCNIAYGVATPKVPDERDQIPADQLEAALEIAKSIYNEKPKYGPIE